MSESVSSVLLESVKYNDRKIEKSIELMGKISYV